MYPYSDRSYLFKKILNWFTQKIRSKILRNLSLALLSKREFLFVRLIWLILKFFYFKQAGPICHISSNLGCCSSWGTNSVLGVRSQPLLQPHKRDERPDSIHKLANLVEVHLPCTPSCDNRFWCHHVWATSLWKVQVPNVVKLAGICRELFCSAADTDILAVYSLLSKIWNYKSIKISGTNRRLII